MRKFYIFGLIGLAVVIIGLAFADQMTLSTYYPAPYGIYNDMVVMNSLGVGVTETGHRLRVEAGTDDTCGNCDDPGDIAGGNR